jgi:hypothetical protein
MASVGTAEYAIEFVRAAMKLRETLSGGVRVLHGIPILLGGTSNIPAIRAMAEINQWVMHTSELNSDITATRSLWDTLIRTKEHGTDCKHLIRLPLSQLKLEMGTFTSMGFSNLEDASPMNEETERTLIQCLVGEINELFSTGLCTSPVIDRFLDDDVFGSETPPRIPLILLGASHLNRMAEHFDDDKWEVHNLSRPGFRITESCVAEAASALADLAKTVQLDSSTVLIQLYDNSVFQVGGPGGVRSLPKPDSTGRYHINGTLQVADKTAVKEMTALLQPLIKALGQAKKAFLSPLTRYWLKPCCDNQLHHLNYSAPTYLPALGASVFRLRDSIRDSLYTKRCPNFRVVCCNRLLGIGPDLSDEAARAISQLWGSDPVHPSRDAYEALARAIERDVLKDDVKYINAPTLHGGNPPKRPRTDLSQSRQGWVTGCSAAVPRRDTYQAPRGHSSRGSVARGSTGRGRGWGWTPRRGHSGWRGKPNK